MKELDLNLVETQILARSRDIAVTKRRTTITMVVRCAAAAAFVTAALMGVSASKVAAIAALYALVTMLEKVFYGKAILAYKSLIRKLTRRIEELERAP
ncbi:MAG: hypothetical protein ACE5I3_14660 [Phycisphaerae bacterium]